MTLGVTDGTVEKIRRILKKLKPDRKSLFLSGCMSFSVMMGMLVAHNRLIIAGLVGPTEGAKVLAVPGFAFGSIGVGLVIGSLAHWKVIDNE